MDEGRAWLAELFLRVYDGVPTVSEAEFEELTGWMRANEQRFTAMVDPDGLVDLGDGIGAVLAELLLRLTRGSRWSGAGEAGEMIRQLKARYGLEVRPGPDEGNP